MDDSEIEVVTFGMFIIDEIDYVSGESKAELLGGAGTYAAIGARLVAGRASAKHIGWIVDKGFDFANHFAELIGSWETNVVYRMDLHRLTTRAWNGYSPGESQHRSFKYLTAKLRLDEDSLPHSLLASKAFHMVCSSARCISLVSGLEHRRQKFGIPRTSKPQIVWEPIPELCVPSELEKLKAALAVVDIVSPNAEELASFFSEDAKIMTQSDMADWMMSVGIGLGGSGALIIREGSEGSTVFTRNWSVHLPAYHSAASSYMVRDPTGGGNAYLGGLAMAMSRKVHPGMEAVEEVLQDFLKKLQASSWNASTLLCAAIYATIAASYVIEQAGMPTLSVSREQKQETWNGESFASRLVKYVAREHSQIENSLQIK